MRALFLIPGNGVSQLQALPAVAATAQQLNFQIQVACGLDVAGVWKLLPAVEKVLPFSFSNASLADWANLLGCVREPDFQACVNLASGRPIDLMLSMSHIPTRVATAGFSATKLVSPTSGGWPDQALETYLRPMGVNLDANAFRLAIPSKVLSEAMAALPSGHGPMLLMVPSGGRDDWPTEQWRHLPDRIRSSLASLRHQQVSPARPSVELLLARAATVAASDVVLASDPLTVELSLLCGVPVVALGRDSSSLPVREGVKGLNPVDGLPSLSTDAVLTALGLG